MSNQGSNGDGSVPLDLIRTQPVNNVQWIDRRLLKANDYNPNVVAPPELDLLRLSILEDGWTQPIVVRDDMEIVDGFHRWKVSAEAAIYALTDGYVPVVFLRSVGSGVAGQVDKGHQMMSTIRHNRARGTHVVVNMADIVIKLVESGMPYSEIQQRLGMEDEEVERLYERGNMLKRGPGQAFNQGWVPR